MKNLLNRIFFAFFMASLLLPVSCDGLFEDIYDTPPVDESFKEGFRPSEGPGASPSRFTLMLQATEYDEWIYVDLHKRTLERKPIPTTLTGEWDGRSGWTYNEVRGTQFTPFKTVRTDAQEDVEHWDFAVHHFDVKTNDGEVLETAYSSLNELPASSRDFSNETFVKDVWSTTNAIVDLKEMMGFRVGYQNSMINLPLTGWAVMDFSNPPPVYSSSDKVYILRMKDGSCAALRLLSYMSEAGTKGFLTVDVIYPY